jgi:hypothetical protein
MTDITIADIDAAEVPLRELETTLEKELALAESQRPTPTTHNRPFELRMALRQLREGASFNDGMDQRLWDVLTSEPVKRLRLRAPGLASLTRLRAKLAEQEAPKPEPEPLSKYRYTGEPWKFKIGGGRWNTGDVLQLTAEVAARWPDKLELVAGPAPSPKPAA